jgi:hypothetical protein
MLSAGASSGLTAYLPASIAIAGNAYTGLGENTGSAILYMLADGTFSCVGGPHTGGDVSGTWLTTGLNTDFQVQLTGSGDSPGVLGTWLGMGTSQVWTLTQTGLGSKSFSGTLALRRTSDSVVVATCNPFTMFTADNLGGGGHTYNGTIACGHAQSFPVDVYGMGNGAGGIATPAYDNAGHSLLTCYDLYVTAVFQAASFSLGGFSSDPGQAYFNSLGAPGGNFSTASAGYGYNAGTGVASWTWTSSPFNMPASGNATVVMT